MPHSSPSYKFPCGCCRRSSRPGRACHSAYLGPSLQQGDFPEGDFFIRSVYSGHVLDIKDGSTEPGTHVILWPRKHSDNDNQLWQFDRGFLVNKKSRLVLEVPGYEGGGDIEPGTALVQNTRRAGPESLNQLWAYNSQLQALTPYDPKVGITAGDPYFPSGAPAVVDSLYFQHEPPC
ncbi:RICIN domain-containing protein [Streptomyces sp. NPDC046866]|uniref:RICIN domain-containing protein n=1 Tax=Streptomyces sp. NPDC046866 TaxID=3154921 RepID=UPI0034565A78